MFTRPTRQKRNIQCDASDPVVARYEDWSNPWVKKGVAHLSDFSEEGKARPGVKGNLCYVGMLPRFPLDTGRVPGPGRRNPAGLGIFARPPSLLSFALDPMETLLPDASCPKPIPPCLSRRTLPGSIGFVLHHWAAKLFPGQPCPAPPSSGCPGLTKGSQSNFRFLL